MLRFPTRGRYALRAMVDLAQHAGGQPVPRHDIAARQEISADYAAQLFRCLQPAELVQGVKGPGGGYLLTHDASRISVGEIVRTVEGPLAVVERSTVDPDGETACSQLAPAGRWRPERNALGTSPNRTPSQEGRTSSMSRTSSARGGKRSRRGDNPTD